MRALFIALLALVLGLNVGPSPRAQSLSSGAGLAQPQVAGFGDSITAGNEDGSGIGWPNQLQAQRPTYWVYNNGYGGQQSGQIAVRMNAYVGQGNQTFSAGFTIPTSGSVTVTFPAGYEPCYRASGQGVLIQTAVSGVTYPGYCADNGSHVYSFTPTSYPGSPVSVPSANGWAAVNGVQVNGCLIGEMGRNNFSSDTQVKADITAWVSAAQRTTSCWALMTILNGAYSTEWSGQPNYLAIKALNDWMAATYPGHVIDIRAALVAAYDPSNPADVIDHGHDVPPYSLRAGDISGTVGAIADASTMAFTTSTALSDGNVLTVGTEKILITGGSSGAYTGTRGYASTTAVSHTNGTAFSAVDILHPGQNPTSPSNPNCVNGYICVAGTVKTWLDANGL